MVIKVSNVSKKLGQHMVLDDVSLQIGKGQIFALVGPNGAGKTTLVRLIMNLYEAMSGDISINGIYVTDRRFDQEKKKIGFLFDNIGLFKDLTAWENIEFFDRIYNPKAKKADRHRRIGQVLQDFDLYDKRYSSTTTFSRGMRQRLVLARAVVNNPEIILLDEPSRGLDLEGQITLRNFLLNCKKNGVTVLINSHDLNELEKVCTHIAFIKKGKIIRSGTYDEIREAYTQNNYLIGGKEVINDLHQIQPEIGISWIIKNEREAVITVGHSDIDILEWLSSHHVKYEQFRKANDGLEELYQEIINEDVIHV
ncbi:MULTISPECIES: ABC transporter ATP-binding protein [Paenibacillus]|uniref:ABC transporter ATP-binding protein n=1 Tax=Paenibacillus agri TaxID=2744309 RepID=A0A850EE30_9BACL|nr:ABC transporter ATP-binding protein [Paenibacillus agri]NUU58968.1 ABC transporter ATP-binding protein [Paenibacillus agri]